MLTLEEIRNDETKNIEFKEEIPQDSILELSKR